MAKKIIIHENRNIEKEKRKKLNKTKNNLSWRWTTLAGSKHVDKCFIMWFPPKALLKKTWHGSQKPKFNKQILVTNRNGNY